MGCLGLLQSVDQHGSFEKRRQTPSPEQNDTAGLCEPNTAADLSLMSPTNLFKTS